ncbi:hypothetical protein Goklo_020375 [Gossypium klotzschianum]|uniref:Uncharacterized protein n=1 Tax=Gossypium klotzschianum TaxID=34286 RepID=A0A7J8USG0_9ROSI|nr:hypothetical protein [Gossypium klotzschianum]
MCVDLNIDGCTSEVLAILIL